MIKEITPKMSPDSLRATLRFLNKFNNMHTKRAQGYEDSDGSKYVGTVENFGDEILLEARKMLMDKPSLKRLFTTNTFSDYFHIDFSDLTDTYAQQNMLVALLNDDTLLHNKKYSILYRNCEYVNVIRSESYGQYRDELPVKNDSKVIRDTFYTTNEVPILLVEDGFGTVEEFPLKLEIDEWTTTTYMVHRDIMTRTKICDGTRPVQKENGKYDVTYEITRNDVGLPACWMTIDLFITDPPIEVSYIGKDSNTPEIISIGTDGQGITHAYPYIDEECLGKYIDGEGLEHNEDPRDWFIKVYCNADIFNPSNIDLSRTLELREIQLIKTSDIRVQPTKTIYIQYNHDNCKFMIEGEGWSIRKAEQGYWDYDARTFNNPYFAYIPFSTFIDNANPDKILKPVFHITFTDTYLPYQGNKGNAVSGIHVDAGTDYTNHSIIKDRGIIHSLQHFGGLPAYFDYLLERDIHRSHVEMYAIRDRLDRINQRVHEKQTAALILDSSVPQSEIKSMIDDSSICIVYDIENKRNFITVRKPPSPNNALSEITYIDENNFGNSRIDGQNNLPKFIYHGNRTFSVSSIDLDPELETARVYCISNDPIEYSNNGSEENPYHRAGRTLARICDIPTEYGQLMHIKNIAPTLLFDDRYVRSEVGFSNDEKELLWNKKYSRWVTSRVGDDVSHNTRRLIFKWYENQNNLVGYPFLKIEYPVYSQLNSKTYLSELYISIGNGGSGYKVGDTFYFTIGGMPIDGIITSISSATGAASSIGITSDDVAIVTTNFYDKITTYRATNVISENGSGLIIRIEFEDDLWESKKPHQIDTVPTDLHSYRYDEFNNIWIWAYNLDTHLWDKKVQLTGTPLTENYYDEKNSIKQERRTLNDTIIFNLLYSKPEILEDYAEEPYTYTETGNFLIQYKTGFNSDTDISELLRKENYPGALYTVKPDVDIQYGVVTYYDSNTPFSEKGVTNPILLPDHHSINFVEYYNKTNKFMISENGLWIYSPTRDTKIQKVISNDFNVDHNSKMVYNKSEITLYDILSYNPETMIISPNGTTTSNIYIHDELSVPKEYKQIETFCRVADMDEIRSTIKELDPDAEVLKYSNIDDSVLRSYCMENMYIYATKKNIETTIIRHIHDKIINKVSGLSHTGIGDQQTGGYIDILNDEFNINITVDGSQNYGIPMTFFQIDDPDYELELIPDNYRIYDDFGNDITSTSVIILGKTKYIFRGDSWKALN